MRHSYSFKSFDGTDIYYEKWVSWHRSPSLLFLHGLGGDLTAWNKEREILFDKGYGSIAVDLRGHGLSGRPREHEAYKLDAFAKDIELLVKKEFKNPPVLVGHCFGGMVAMFFIAGNPHIAKSLILIDTNYKAPYYSDLFLKHVSLLHLFHLTSHFASHLHLKGHVDFERFKNTGDFNAIRIASDLAHVSLKSYLNIIDHIMVFNGLELLKKIRIPTLIIEGSQDSVFPPIIAKELHRRIVSSQIKYITGANHILVLNNPKDLSRTIYSFLRLL